MEIPSGIEELYQQRGPLHNSLVESLHSILPSITSQFSKVVFVVDAIDECADRVGFLRSIKRFRTLEKVNLLVTSRYELDIKLEFEGLPDLVIKPSNITSDVELYIVNEIERQPKLRRLRETTKSEITCSLVEQANGMFVVSSNFVAKGLLLITYQFRFRWVKCCLDQIGTLRNDKAIKAALKSLPRTLEATYERTLCQIPVADEDMAKGVLRWLIYNWRPMTIDQILEGIAVEIGETTMDPENKLNEPEDILDLCRGLAVMDDRSRILRLAHFTVKEYLVSTGISQGPAASYHMPPETSNPELAKICLTYLMFDDFETGSCPTQEELGSRLELYPLYHHAACSLYLYILEYIKAGADEVLDQLLLQFFLLDGNSGQFAAWDQANAGFSSYRDLHPKKTPLFCAALLGLNQAVVEILKTDVDVNGYCGADNVDFSGDESSFRFVGGSPLVGAILGGHEDMVRLLLENGANPNLPGNPNSKSYIGDDTPIFTAASAGRVKCLQILLDHGADEGEHTQYGRYGQSMQMAVENDHPEVIGVFLETEYFQTGGDSALLDMLLLSAISGIEGIVRVLLERRGDVVISSEHEFDIFTDILLVASERGHFKAMHTILQNPGIKTFCVRDDIFPKVLRSAAWAGDEKVIGLLLSVKKDLSAEDFNSSLHIAAAKGHARALELLLRAGASPDGKDADGWTPVLCALQYQQEYCVEKLVKGVKINLDVINNKPICWDVARTANISEDGLEITNSGIKMPFPMMMMLIERWTQRPVTNIPRSDLSVQQRLFATNFTSK